MQPFRSAGSLYKNEGLAGDVEVLMTGTIPEHTEPITWTRTYKGGRIFYTSLGHPQDFTEESFRRLLANALFWTAGEPARVPTLHRGNAPTRGRRDVNWRCRPRDLASACRRSDGARKDPCSLLT